MIHQARNRQAQGVSNWVGKMHKCAAPRHEKTSTRRPQTAAEHGTHLPGGDTDWHWLAMAQHHGLPTRLLDWTYSPYVALHFAVSNIDDYGEPGAVWRVNYAEAHQHLNSAAKTVLSRFGANIFSTNMLADALARGIDELDALHAPGFDFAIFF